MEALRIVAMSMILLLHFLGHGLKESAITPVIYPLFMPFVYSGVDIFFLISGYFLIKFSVRSLIRFYFLIVFFSLANIVMLFCAGLEVPISTIVIQLLFPRSCAYWFVSVYFLLMATAPILNIGLKALTRQQLKYGLIVMFGVIVCVGGHQASYTYLNGFMMYVLGYYIARFRVAEPFSKGALLGGYFGCCIFMALVAAAVMLIIGKPYRGFLNYDNPFVILSALFLSLYFAKLNFQSRWVNSLASAAFGCYLLQDGLFGFGWFYAWQNSFVVTHGYGLSLAVMLAACFVGFWLLSWLLTQFLNLWLAPATNAVHSLLLKLYRRVRRGSAAAI